MMTRQVERRVLFDTVADLYNEARPGYPAEMIEDIISITGVPQGGRILEVGAGTGQATLGFAKKGFEILSLELGANLAERARQNLKDYPNATILNVIFEDWEVEEGAFDLVISGSAFHWIPAEVGYSRCAQALKEKRWLALFWNGDAKPSGGVYDAIREVYIKLAPEMDRRGNKHSQESVIGDREKELRESGLFTSPIAKRYPWTRRLSADEYVRLTCTYSDHIALSEEKRQTVCEALRKTINHHGGYIDRQYLTRLFIAQKL
ncbi:MAG: class I SAM-dependent methyltransferase [bacterium]